MQSIETSSSIDAPFKASPESSQYDIVCVGFGPAALAIAIAIHERGASFDKSVLFLERQAEFGWHTGMLLPGTKMQISFMKDLATMRNPQSYFTFVNYLHKHNRLANFINLSTQTPFREEFNDYMKWCASHFRDQVTYNQEVLNVSPGQQKAPSPESAIDCFWVTSRDVQSGDVQRICSKHVIVANGGEYSIPKGLKSPDSSDRIVHSSQYLNRVPQQFKDENGNYNFAVVGGGQSAVEISEDLQSRYPKSRVSLIFRDSALRPSDDSPFVNEIFDPASVDEFYSLDSAHRKQTLKKNKATNYSVVRLPLIEHIYEKIYRQRLLKPEPRDWTLSIYNNSEVFGAKKAKSGEGLILQLRNTITDEVKVSEQAYDLVVLATGYHRRPFSGILKDLKPLLLSESEDNGSLVQRNYRLLFKPGSVVRDAAIWLQGSCETTHGISDTLLSILAVRADELLDSINASRKTVEVKAHL
ncbi:L-ornithine 5-monooxygenase, putative [Talaromyces stipitatus ATCC 10500]|uniref:L-ornithine N(5)-monooxygenase n=1 Tax=Talaromyces stipitatus (strain ATCC 10500 / CBS 375.48 / QM 6759 / NRRL 1006) TaxID=441959 RepID=B8MJ91_TALSN|nr:L-ornithine 5-monooxygenase, putative [Talaromyces stipitatus ATCC 10500]EED14680.1 L-ornithine 5-monooxygenase, putative [Talaromyces stipitatus ATCC 10500]